MDSEQARHRACAGGAVLVLDAPKSGLWFGVDLKWWQTGPAFKGVKMLPPGPHLVGWALGDGPRSGVWHGVRLRSQEDIDRDMTVVDAQHDTSVLVLQWLPERETMVVLDDEAAGPWRSGVRAFDFDAGLGAYDEAACSAWPALVSCVTVATTDRLRPIEHVITSMDASARAKADTERELAHARRVLHEQGHLEAEAEAVGEPRGSGTGTGKGKGEAEAGAGADGGGGVRSEDDAQLPFYVEVERSIVPAGATPAQVTAAHMDRSAVLDAVVQRVSDEQQVVAELQASFAMFLCLHAWHGFHQWKTLLALLCACSRGLEERPKLYKVFLAAVCTQLLHAPEDFFNVELTQHNFIQISLRDLFARVAEVDAMELSLEQSARTAKAALERHFGVSLCDDCVDDEDAPVIVYT